MTTTKNTSSPVRRRTRVRLLALGLALAASTGLASPASAWRTSGTYGNDGLGQFLNLGHDYGISVICSNGVARTVAPGKSSASYCPDVSYVKVPKGYRLTIVGFPTDKRYTGPVTLFMSGDDLGDTLLLSRA